MAWRHDGYVYKGRRKNGWPHDVCAPDGGLSYGWRRVSSGRVKFNGQYFTAPELSTRNGTFIRVEIGDYWGSYYLAYLGAEGVTPENYETHHSSFYQKSIHLNDDDAPSSQAQRKEG